jgi:cellulose biosynthesis protein BcsQ
MTIPVIAFFNNKGGVGKTSLVYHLAWMYAELDLRVVAADLDPQANLTAAFLSEDRLEEIWEDRENHKTIFKIVEPLIEKTGDIAEPDLEYIEDNLALLVGDMSLSKFEDDLAGEWPKCSDGTSGGPFRVISAFWRVMQKAAQKHQADIILMDLGPNLGAINRAALVAADYVVVPLSPDLFSLQGLHNLGPTLWRWRKEWQERLKKNPAPDLALPKGSMEPVGYIVLQHSVRLDRPVKAYEQWIGRIPGVYREKVLDQSGSKRVSVKNDPLCLALLKHYRSLIPMAQEARKAIFQLKPADGAIGSHAQAVEEAYQDFRKLARMIAQRTGIALPLAEDRSR